MEGIEETAGTTRELLKAGSGPIWHCPGDDQFGAIIVEVEAWRSGKGNNDLAA